MMKIAVMAIALVMGSLAFGQQTKTAASTPEERAYHLTEKMTKQLSLTADQSAKISEINIGIAQKNEGIRNATNITKEQKVEILQSNHDARMNMYKSILTEEQYKKCEQFEAALAKRIADKKAAQGETSLIEDEL